MRILVTGGAGFIGSRFVHHQMAHERWWRPRKAATEAAYARPGQ